ncbi:MAG: hypothetical protein ACRCXN_05720 [Bacteroidales bacterium]
MRTESKYCTKDALSFLNKLASADTSVNEYRDSFFQLGKILGLQIDKLIPDLQNGFALACSSEDSDWLASGLLSQLEHKDPSVAVFWNERQTIGEFTMAPIVRSYQEDLSQCKILVIVKSIIFTSCVVKTQLLRLISEMTPERIIIASPVFFKDADVHLKNEFPEEISDKFEFIYFVIDTDTNERGEVVPGIGGSVYERLGLGNNTTKNKYVPELVKKRRALCYDY